jgi:hypothetical protein
MTDDQFITGVALALLLLAAALLYPRRDKR